MKYSFIFLSIIILFAKSINGQTPTSVSSSTKPIFIAFTPISFSNKFSLNVIPVLNIHSGDTVQTETIDAFGRDKKGVKRQGGGNPLTGPFYIEGAKAGDVLRIKLNLQQKCC